MDFKQYQYVIRVAELKSVTRAAQSLYVSQPSLSAFIAKAEEELGAVIFDRNQTPLELTPVGEVFVETGRKILHLQEQMKNLVTEMAQNKKGRLRVGIPSSRAAYMLPIIYPAFHGAFPGVDLEMTEGSSRTLLGLLQKGNIDIAVMPLFAAAPGLCYELIYKEELLLIAQKGYLQADDYREDGTVNITKAARYPFIMLKQGHGIRSTLDKYFGTFAITPKILFETGNNSTALRMAGAGEGLAVVPRMTIEICSDMDNIDVLCLPPDGLFWDIAAARQEANIDNYLQSEFIRIAVKVFQTG